jgi:hypothetical protein
MCQLGKIAFFAIVGKIAYGRMYFGWEVILQCYLLGDRREVFFASRATLLSLFFFKKKSQVIKISKNKFGHCQRNQAEPQPKILLFLC